MFLTHPVPEPTLIPVVAPIPVAVTETVDKVKPVLATTTTVGEQELLPEPENILYSNNTDDHEEYQEVFKNSVFWNWIFSCTECVAIRINTCEMNIDKLF